MWLLVAMQEHGKAFRLADGALSACTDQQQLLQESSIECSIECPFKYSAGYSAAET